MTLAPCAAAHSMPAMTQESSPQPSSPSTLPMIRLAPGATPFSSAAGRGAAAADGRGGVGAVAVAVVGGLAGHEADRLADPAGQVGVVGVDAGVEHRDLDARAVEAGRPGLRRADLRGALGQVGVHLAVEPDLRRRRRPARGRRRRLRAGTRARGQRRPRRAGVMLVDAAPPCR